MNIARKGIYIGSKHPNWKGGRIKIICKICKREFKIFPNRIKTAKFCSLKCYQQFNKGKNSSAWKGGLPYCNLCNKQLPNRRSKICRKCYFKSCQGNKHWNWKGGLVLKICEICGKKFETKPAYVNKRRTCSYKCMGKYKTKTYIKEDSPNWQGGTSFEPYPVTFNQQLKDKIRVRDNFICQLCGTPELECNTRLFIHHINYNKRDCNFENLISLCNKCHTKTNYNRDYWKNYFIMELFYAQKA